MSEKPLKYGLFILAIITLINFTIFFIFSFIWKGFAWFSFGQILLFLLASFISSFIISFFIISTAPVLKDFLITYRRLLRLENLSHPILMRLSLEAPGTYHHSLAVANLAHKAAKAIGADTLLARVGAYYHDIGKLENPQYFIENQKNGENIHEEINDPQKSSKIIIGHVDYGLKLASEYKIPKEITAFIPEHQGTTLISYFYNKAKEKDKKTKKSDYRYLGPKPLSRETAILMLADAIEAKIRLLDKVTLDKITQIVDETIEERVEDRQLELSGLTEPMIVKIRQSFIDTLSVMFHQRIRYPDEKNKKFKFKNPLFPEN